MTNYNHLFYFHTIAQEGSLCAASRRLGIAQSTISEQLKQLERSLGAKLFLRGNGGMRLTEAGRRAHEHTETMFRAAERLEQSFDTNGNDARPVLTVGITPSVGTIYASRFFVEAMKRSNDARIHFRHADYNRLLHELMAFELDILISDSRPSDSSRRQIASEVIYQPEMVAVANPRVADKIVEFPRGLTEVPYFAFSVGSQNRWEIDHYFHSQGISPPIFAESDHADVICEAAQELDCFAILPRPMIEVYVGAGRLQVLGEIRGVRSTVYAQFRFTDTPPNIESAVRKLRREA